MVFLNVFRVHLIVFFAGSNIEELHRNLHIFDLLIIHQCVEVLSWCHIVFNSVGNARAFLKKNNHLQKSKNFKNSEISTHSPMKYLFF